MDRNMFGDLNSLPEEDRAKMSTMMEQLQVRDRCGSDIMVKENQFVVLGNDDVELLTMSRTLRMYNSLVERCFNDCIDTFYRKSLTKQEDTCVRRCAEKFLRFSMRTGLRFAEINQGESSTD